MTERVTHSATIRNGLITHAKALGLFEVVHAAEPKTAPEAPGVHLAVMEGPGQALPAASTLTGTAVEVTARCQLYWKLDLSQPTIETDYEDRLTAARDTYTAALHSGIQVAAGIEFNPNGMHGATRLSWEPSYLDQDHVKFRIHTVTVPFIVHNAWTQTR